MDLFFWFCDRTTYKRPRHSPPPYERSSSPIVDLPYRSARSLQRRAAKRLAIMRAANNPEQGVAETMPSKSQISLHIRRARSCPELAFAARAKYDTPSLYISSQSSSNITPVTV